MFFVRRNFFCPASAAAVRLRISAVVSSPKSPGLANCVNARVEAVGAAFEAVFLREVGVGARKQPKPPETSKKQAFHKSRIFHSLTLPSQNHALPRGTPENTASPRFPVILGNLSRPATSRKTQPQPRFPASHFQKSSATYATLTLPVFLTVKSSVPRRTPPPEQV